MLVNGIKPYLVRNMLRKDLHGHDTICSTIQEIFLMTDDVEIKLKARVAMRLAKDLYNELKRYKELG